MEEHLREWKETHDDQLDAHIQRTKEDKEDTVEVTLIRVPPPPQSSSSSSNRSTKKPTVGLGKIKPPGVGFIWYTREKKDRLVTLSNGLATQVFRKARPNLKENVEMIQHETLGNIEVPVIPSFVWNARVEAKKVKEDATNYWNAIGTSRHSTPMNSHSKNPAKKDLKKLRSRSLHKAWSEFKQSQYCTSIQLNDSAYQIFSQTCTRLERKKWDEAARERKRKVDSGEIVEEQQTKVEEVEPKRKKRRR